MYGPRKVSYNEVVFHNRAEDTSERMEGPIMTPNALHKAIILIAAALMGLGCSMATGAARQASPTSTPMALPTSFPTTQPLPTAQPTAMAAATSTPAPTSTSAPVANCTPRADWPIYIVVSGDTLADIAKRAASTVNELATGNCLANANAIFAGQQLRVPRIPAVPTPHPTATPYPVPTSMDNAPRILSFRLATDVTPKRLEWITWNASAAVLSVSGPRGAYIGYGIQPANGTFALPDLGMDFAPYATFTLSIKDMAGRDVTGPNGLPLTARVDVEIGAAPLDCPATTAAGSGNILVSPVLGMVDRCSYVRSNQTIWVSWEGVSGLSSAEYYFLPVVSSGCGTAGNANVIGVDQNIADGNMITWYVGPGPCAGVLYAFGYNGETLVESRQSALVVYSQ